MRLTKTDTLWTVAAIVVILALLYYYQAPKVLPTPSAAKENISEPLKDLSSQVTGGSNGYLRGLKEVQLVISMNDNARAMVDENVIRMEMEANLRRLGLSVVARSAPYVLTFALSTQRRDALSVYNSDCHLVERVTFLREGESPMPGLYQLWNVNFMGTVGLDNARDALVRQAGEAAREFAGAWAEANAGL